MLKFSKERKRRLTESANSHINRLIRKTIDQTKQEDYNLDHGKPDLKGSKREEVNNGNF